jgi:hypothetical protein
LNDKLRDHLISQGYKVTTLTTDDLRKYLKSKGWKRRDRRNQELWIRPWDGVGYEPLGITLRSAVKRQLKQDGFTAS